MCVLRRKLPNKLKFPRMTLLATKAPGRGRQKQIHTDYSAVSLTLFVTLCFSLCQHTELKALINSLIIGRLGGAG